MLNFKAPYNRTNFVDFLQWSFLPTDYEPEEQEVAYTRGAHSKILNITDLGWCKSLNLHVLEVIHNSSNDARVSLSKEIFPFLQRNAYHNCLIAFVPFNSRDVYRLSFVKQTPKLVNNKLDWEHSNPKRYSFLLGVEQPTKTPERYLFDRVTDITDLENRFSVETLTKEFYNELFDWYRWALTPETNIHYPNDPCDKNDDRQYLAEHLIRLITRLMFVWFIKQKDFIPSALFDTQILEQDILQDFEPDSLNTGNYYNAILQNLFFASLNKKITERKFASGTREYGIKNLYRDNDGRKNQKSWFKISHDEVIDLFKPVPFLNGGLFECLDTIKEEIEENTAKGKPKIKYFDGFSRDSDSQKRAFIPNAVFFAQEQSVLLPNDKKPKMVSGIINIFKKYNFTVEENTPNDVDVALDPELLGKVFENLLAAYNPETQETARKATGSFYTPREIVDYMVEQSIDAYLVQKVGENYNDYPDKVKDALMTIKVIDPACGSGAFPMGILNNIYNKIKEIDPTANPYETKLTLIEKCIYGIDIQPIAVQISKLRFFISLICEQAEKSTDPETNYGIEQLPNLETKFVAANTLVKIQKIKTLSFDDVYIEEIQNKLAAIRERHFQAKTWDKKKEYRDRDQDLRKELVAKLQQSGMVGPELIKQASQIAQWNPYNQNDSAGFFDAEWMFGLKDGFDIVIGNPPYISLEKIKGDIKTYYTNTDTWKVKTGSIDLYCLFYERGLQLLKERGHLCYITSNKWLRSGYGEGCRRLFSTQYTPKLLLDLGGQIFKSATVDTNILLVQNAFSPDNKTWCWTKPKDIDPENMSDLIAQSGQYMQFGSDPWVILSPIEQSIKAKIEKYGTPLSKWDVNIYRGILTGCNEAFIIDEDKKNELIAKDPKSAEIIRPILRGKDIKRYGYDFANLYLINIECGFTNKNRGSKQPEEFIKERYPYIYNHFMEVAKETTRGKGLIERDDKGDYWWELRSCAYTDEFSKPKICYSETNNAKETKIALDTEGYYPDKTCFVLVSNKNDDIQHIYKILSSEIFTWYMYNTSPLLNDCGISLTKESVLRFPLCKKGHTYGLNEEEINCISESLKS